MPSFYSVAAAGLVPAPAARTYALIADYRHGHPRIVPPKVFSNFVVEEGGVGAGTRVRFDMTAFGRTITARAVVTEPDPGRVLVESIPDQDIVTTFTVEPEGPDGCRATIATRLPRRGGLPGWAERLFTTAFLRRVYAQELRRLAEVAAGS